MMKFVNKISSSSLKQRHFRPSILRASLCTTQIEPSPLPTQFQRLEKCHEQRVSLIPILDEWIVEGKQIDDQQLKRFIMKFKKTCRFEPTLEIAEWMSDNKHFTITPAHAAVQLDLVSEVHGVEQAENYFNRLDDSLINRPVYASLLNCYASAKSLEKAEATMEKIKKMNSYTTRDYNTMLSLYSQMGMHEKLDSMVQEMEDKGIGYDGFMYNIRLNAYAGFDLEAMEKLLMKMEADPGITVDFCSYVTAAKGYIEAGASEKALAALKKAERMMRGPQRTFVYGVLVTFYATMEKKDDVYRIWNLLQKYGKLNNQAYVSMINSLEKLDYLDGAKKILEQWEEKKAHTDVRIPNIVISAYCKKGDVGEAEIILNRLIETGKKPTASTWDCMAHGYYKNGQMEKAVEMMKKAFLASFPAWKPNLTTLAACLECLKNKGDADATQELLMLLEKCSNFSVDFKERTRKYLSNVIPRFEVLESDDGSAKSDNE